VPESKEIRLHNCQLLEEASKKWLGQTIREG